MWVCVRVGVCVCLCVSLFVCACACVSAGVIDCSCDRVFVCCWCVWLWLIACVWLCVVV